MVYASSYAVNPHSQVWCPYVHASRVSSLVFDTSNALEHALMDAMCNLCHVLQAFGLRSSLCMLL